MDMKVSGKTDYFFLLQDLGIGFVPYCLLGLAFFAGMLQWSSRFRHGDRSYCQPQFQFEALKHHMLLARNDYCLFDDLKFSIGIKGIDTK